MDSQRFMFELERATMAQHSDEWEMRSRPKVLETNGIHVPAVGEGKAQS
jgi:hypothetical protein